MKRQWTMIIFAAAVTAVSALAQDVRASIPFDFTAGCKHLTSGTYHLARVKGSGVSYILQVYKAETKESVLMSSNLATDNTASSWADGKAVFHCTSSGCALAEVVIPGESYGRAFATPRPKKAEKERTVAVRLTNGAAAGF